MSAHEDTHAHEDHGHHHKETFVTKYIFSQDHKMIAKQYLITGTIMGVIGVFIAAFIVKSLPLSVLKWLVIVVIAYTSITMLKKAFSSKK